MWTQIITNQVKPKKVSRRFFFAHCSYWWTVIMPIFIFFVMFRNSRIASFSLILTLLLWYSNSSVYAKVCKMQLLGFHGKYWKFFSWKFKFKQYPNLSIFPIVLIFSYLAIASFLVTTITKLNSQSRICHDYIKRRVKMFFNEYPTNRSVQIKLK